MRSIFAICRREILSFFVSPVAYFVITGFILMGGYFFFNLLTVYNQVIRQYAAIPYFQGEMPNLNQWVVEGLFHTMLIIMVFLIPLLTMRILAEERRSGTFELLATSPLSVGQIVFGKFLGVAFVLFLMMLLLFCFPLLLVVFGNPGPEVVPMVTGIGGLFLCGLAFASVGMAVSSVTESQIVAGISAMVVLLLLYVIHIPAESVGEVGKAVLEYLSPVVQVGAPLRGVITVQSIVYFVSLIFLGLFFSQRALEAQRWR